VGRTNLTKDHILPVQPKNIEMRGTNNADNIQALCKSCNSSKGNRILERIIK
jgi:5-methylcytosine-specific restriction endonuclease McrA